MQRTQTTKSPGGANALRVVDPAAPPPIPRGRRAQALLAEILIQRGVLTPDDLLIALALQRHQNLQIGEILVSRGVVTETELLSALSIQHGTGIADLNNDPPDPALAHLLGASKAIALNAVVWRRAGSALVVVTNRPDRSLEIREAFAESGQRVIIALAGRDAVQDAQTVLYGTDLARIAEGRAPQDNSCRNIRPVQLARVVGLVAAGFLLGLLLFPTATIVTVYSLAILVFAANVALKFAAAGAALRAERALDKAAKPASPPPLVRMPVVTILVPLFKENEVAGGLIANLSRLDYPPELLDVMLVVEEDDHLTREAIATCRLPSWMRAITVPPGHPRTKPRALNYALNFARGSVVGIYDAEDRPEPDQIRRVVRCFAALPPRVACLQGRLDYYNATHNWLSRCFTVEYATWFRLLLPGVQQLGLFVPLGGTTVFLRRHVLEKVGGWDAHNVTEDAELGLRLTRHGYDTEVIDTTTFEEANAAVWPWVKQRSRWLKGYLMTWISAMRHPRRLLRELGPRRFIGLQVQLLGAVLGFLLAPLLWSLALKPFGVRHPMDAVLSPIHYGILGVAFVAVLLVGMGISAMALRAPHLRRLRRWVPLVELYYPLATVASWLAASETMMRPFHWSKTAHGQFSHPSVAAPVTLYKDCASERSAVAASSLSRTTNAIER